MNAYHESLDERQHLDEFEEKANKGDIEVLKFMRTHAGQPFTPPEVWRAVDPEGKHPLTNVRRSMTNLTMIGRLVHQKDQAKRKAGIYGRANTTWVYPENATQGKLF